MNNMDKLQQVLIQKLTESVDWDYYDNPKFKAIDKKYLPDEGEGELMANQIVTAVNKLIYKYYNDGDIYDNSHIYHYNGNDLSDYANWLLIYVPETKQILYRINEFKYFNNWKDDYERILKDLADLCCNEQFLEKYNKPKQGSIYNCPGNFIYEDPDGYDEDEW